MRDKQNWWQGSGGCSLCALGFQHLLTGTQIDITHTRSDGFCQQDVKKAVSMVEVAAQGAPWAATDAYVGALREGRGSLALTGAGDPTGRGRGYSYTRDIRRVSATVAPLQPQ